MGKARLRPTPGDPNRDEYWSDKRELFVREYISNGFNATKAALAAGYSADGAASTGCDIMKTKTFVTRLNEYLAQSGMSVEECIARVSKAARLNILQYYRKTEKGDWELDFEALRDSPDAELVVQVRRGRSGEMIVTWIDKLKSLELIGRANGVFVDRVIEQPGAPMTPEALSAAAAELAQYGELNAKLVATWRGNNGPPTEAEPEVNILALTRGSDDRDDAGEGNDGNGESGNEDE